jgi:hypothetical protein
MIIVNDLRPVFPFVTQIDGLTVQIKPYFSYYRWLDWIDLSGLDQSAAIAAIELSLIDMEDAITAAYLLATDAAALAVVANDQATDALNASSVAQATADSALAAAAAVAQYNDYHFFLPRQMLPLSGAGFGQFTIAATSPLNGAFLMSGNGGQVYIALAMQAGNWRIEVNCIALATGCTFLVEIGGGGTVLTLENYNATQINNHVQTADFTIAGDGRQQMTLTIAGHPAGSTGYNLWVSYIAIYKI